MAEANKHEKISESPVVVWFDTNAYKEENQKTRESLEATIGNLMVLDDKAGFNRLLGRDAKIKRLVLIISGQLGKEFISSIHHFTSILSIYVFCVDKKSNEEWAKEYTKVRAVITELNELVEEILSDPQMNKTLM